MVRSAFSKWFSISDKEVATCCELRKSYTKILILVGLVFLWMSLFSISLFIIYYVRILTQSPRRFFDNIENILRFAKT